MRTPPSALALLLVASASCTPSYDVALSALPTALQPVSGATEIVARGDGEGFGLRYQVVAPYPAVDVLAKIHARIPAEWKPRLEDHLNPGIPTSFVRGWTRYGDRTSHPESWVHRWSSEWQNPAGDIISYDLMYVSPGSVSQGPPIELPSSSTLKVIASLTPRRFVE